MADENQNISKNKQKRQAEAQKLINGIYSSSNYLGKNNKTNQLNSRFTLDRAHLVDKNVSAELNTYLNFGIFPTFADTYNEDIQGVDPNDPNSKTYYGKSDVGTPGVRSLFNKNGAIIIGSSDGSYSIDLRDGNAVHNFRISNNVPLMDSPCTRQRINDANACTVRDLVRASEHGSLGKATYAYSDFMYCKYLGRVSNNYMITLRRFPIPVDDFISSVDYVDYTNKTKTYTNSCSTGSNSQLPGIVSNNTSSIGCMVTWLGVSGNEMSNILKYSYKMPFKEQESEMQDNKTEADANKTMMSGLFSAFDESYRNAYVAGRGGEAFNYAMSHFGISLGDPPYTDYRTFKDRNKVLGPVDAIRKTYIRSDEGLEFKQNMTLVFEYELRSYNGINPRQAMLDLISNILNVTYTTGAFWRGGIRGNVVSQSNIFTNLNIFKNTNGTFTDFADAFAKDLTDIGSKFSASLGLGEGFSLENAWKTIKGALNTIGGMLLGGMLNKMGRPQKAMYNSLLSPAPIGFWHVMIGNPKAPIMSIGNMIITNATIEHNGPLGLDNFPTELKVTVELDRGKPRDLRDIERLYMHGHDRIYSSMSDKVFNMYKNAYDYRQSIINNAYTYDPYTNYDFVKIEDVTPSTNEKDKYNIKSQNKDNSTSSSSTTITPSKVSIEVNGNSEIKDLKDASGFENLSNSLKKYIGTTDILSIYYAAAEQEYGAVGVERIKTEGTMTAYNAKTKKWNTTNMGNYDSTDGLRKPQAN